MALRYAKAGGVGQYFSPEGLVETNTKKCQHCGALVDIPVMRDFHKYMDICHVCGEAHCLEPACLAQGCSPLKKKIDAMEERYYRRRQLSKLMGLD